MAIDWRARAGVVWPKLVELAASKKLTTYGELAPEVDIFHRNLRLALDPIGVWCMKNQLPPLTILVVDAATGRPGGGIVGTSPEQFDEDVARVYAHNWQAVRNPLGLFMAS